MLHLVGTIFTVMGAIALWNLFWGGIHLIRESGEQIAEEKRRAARWAAEAPLRAERDAAARKQAAWSEYLKKAPYGKTADGRREPTRRWLARQEADFESLWKEQELGSRRTTSP
jgi:hypothetical protein